MISYVEYPTDHAAAADRAAAAGITMPIPNDATAPTPAIVAWPAARAIRDDA